MSDNTGQPVESSTPATVSEEESQKRYDVMCKVSPRLLELTETISLVERAMAASLPEVIGDRPLGDVVDLVSDISEAIKALEEKIAGVKARINYAKEVSVPARFDKDRVKTFNTDKFRVTRTTRVFASILGDDTGNLSAFEWLRENDYDALIKETVNASSLSAAAKELMENGMELPDDLFRVHMKDGISITKLKPKRS